MIFLKRIGKFYLNIIFFYEYIELRITTYNDSMRIKNLVKNARI